MFEYCIWMTSTVGSQLQVTVSRQQVKCVFNRWSAVGRCWSKELCHGPAACDRHHTPWRAGCWGHSALCVTGSLYRILGYNVDSDSVKQHQILFNTEWARTDNTALHVHNLLLWFPQHSFPRTTFIVETTYTWHFKRDNLDANSPLSVPHGREFAILMTMCKCLGTFNIKIRI